MKLTFKALVQKKKKYDYHKDKKYEYEQAFVIIPSKVARQLKKGKRVSVSIN